MNVTTESIDVVPPKPPPQRVLVVDDNADAAESLSMLLSLDGHTVEFVLDGPAALKKISGDFAPDLVLLDIGLPGMNGYEVARAIRATESGRAIRLFALTGWGQPEDLARAYAAGFDGHLLKPVDDEALRAALMGSN